jgi:hypothetical protein
VGDEPDIRLVDAHPERDRRRDDVDPVGHEPVLDVRPLPRPETGVVCGCPSPGRSDRLGRPFGACPRRGVDDARRLGDRDPLDEGAELRVGVRVVLHAQVEVRAIEPARDDDRIAEPEPLHDLLPDGWRRGRRQAEDRRAPESLRDRAETSVLGAEVVAPFAHAVHLVDDEERGARGGDPLEDLVIRELLRREKEELDLAPGEAPEDLLPLPRRECRVECGGGAELPSTELLELILLAGEQGRDHDRRPRPLGRRELVDGRLAPAGGQERERVATGDDRPDGRFLSGQEPGMTECLPGETAEGPGVGCGRHECRR